jgi:ABC-2 type transport system permease protein
MRKFFAIAAFEARTRLKRISTWVYFLVFLAISMTWIAAAGGAISTASVSFGSGKVWVNSPYAVAQTTAFLGIFAMTVIAALMGRAVQQDFEYRSENFFFTAPIAKWQYLGGRFVGALVVLLVILSSIALGSALGTLLPGIDPDRLGPMRAAVYAIPFVTVLLPNLIWIGGVFFCVAALTRRMLPVYIGSIICLIGYLAANGLMRDFENKTLAAMLDPFGSIAMSRVTEYWTVSEKNTRLIPFEGALLWNRVLWLGVGLMLIAWCVHRFAFAYSAGSGFRSRGKAAEYDAAGDAKLAAALHPVVTNKVNGLRALPRMVWLNFRETVKSIYFGVIAFSGVLFFIAASTTSGSIFGTTTWPVTYQMLELVSGTFIIFMWVIITFYGGELVWRERENRFDQISDALPIPTWLPFVAKLLALMLVPVVLQAVLMLCGMAIQTAKGYHHYEVGLYLRDMFGIDLVNYWLVCALAITVHSVVNQKYLGHFVMVAYFVIVAFSSLLGFEHNLYKYGQTIGYTYSDMNGYGHFLPRLRAFQAYYAAAALLLLVAAYLFWVRGSAEGAPARLRAARARFSPGVATVSAIAAVGMVTLGGFIFYNTNVLNHYRTEHDGQVRRADYEKKYKALAAAPQPKIVAVKVAIDLYPAEQRVRMHGTYALVNKNAVPVDAVHLVFLSGENLVVNQLAFDPPAQQTLDDMDIGIKTFTLAKPLAPGASLSLAFDLELPTRGFTNTGSNTSVVYNGSFVNGNLLLPGIGYDERGELETDRDRKKFGLAPKERMRDINDPAGLAQNYITQDADWIDFAATVSTDSDQIAVAPGYLQREWTQGNRRYFDYKMDSPILDFFAVQSARYAIKRDHWNDVAIEVYYQPGHEYNLDRMIDAVKASLAYYTANFGPYQHKQFRILEFPRYAAFAQAFPNTIPYSEGIGFIARVRDGYPKDIDYPYYVTAHEAAHQWWAHQVVGANVQGATMLSETLAQYSALMVMKHKYGEPKMQRFLSYELDRYLIGRSTEQKKELPLARVENQDYIHYRKGSIVMYALQDYIGEAKVNQALRAFRDATAYRGPPYPNTEQLIAELRKVTPQELQYVIDDMFETITLYDNRAVSAKARALGDGRYEVTLSAFARKLRADSLGKETDAPLHDWIDIGVLDADNKPLYLEKRKIESAENEFIITVDERPTRAGIDPYNKLIDRRPNDNTVAIEIR